MKYPLTGDLQISIDRTRWAKRPPTTAEMAGIITDQFHFAKDRGGRLYFYSIGRYHADGEQVIEELTARILLELNHSETWSTRRTKEIVEYIRTQVPRLWDQPPMDYVNVANGILHVQTLTLYPHQAGWLSTIQLPIHYDPNARCPAWEYLAATTLPCDAPDLAWEVAAWLMVPNMRLQKALILVGYGGNGKSTLLNGLIAFLGKQNVSAISLHKLEHERFASARLRGKLANICGDLPNTKLKTTSTFKSIVGGDRIAGEYKFRDIFEFEPFVRLVYSCNELPQPEDSSDGWYRRLIIVPFEKVFQENTERGKQLEAALVEPSELSGLLNRALALFPRVLAQGITVSPSMKEAIEEYRGLTDPINQWLDANVVLDPSQTTIKRFLLDAYNATAKVKISAKRFGTAVKRKFPEIRDVQHMVEGKKTHCYEGIRYVGPTKG